MYSCVYSDNNKDQSGSVDIVFMAGGYRCIALSSVDMNCGIMHSGPPIIACSRFPGICTSLYVGSLQVTRAVCKTRV